MRTSDMCYETTTSIASSGSGAVTTTAVTGVPRVSTIFGTGTVHVKYVIEQASTSAWEIGYGTFSSNVLTRTTPLKTWDGSSTYADGNGGAVSAFAFSAAPTAGDVIIRLAPLASDKGPIVDVRQNTITGDTNWRDYYISGHINWNGSGTNAVLTANREYYQAFRLDTPGLISGIQCEVTNAVASSTMNLALYELATSGSSIGLPINKIVQFTGFTTAATGIKTDTATGSWSPTGGVRVQAGWYALGFIPSAAISLRCYSLTNGTTPTPYGRLSSYGYGETVYAAGSGTTMPATPAPTTLLALNNTTGSNVWIGLKVTA